MTGDTGLLVGTTGGGASLLFGWLFVLHSLGCSSDGGGSGPQLRTELVEG